MESSLINERGFWMTDTAKGHAHDPPLREALIDFYQKNLIKSILDLGCGPGYYTIGFKQKGFICDGYDGNPNTPLLTKGHCNVLDLTFPVELNQSYDCVLSLEVGEHIPKIYEDIFLDNLTKHTSKWIILSWALPGQNGDGHVNCQTNEYVEQQINKRGFIRKSNMEEEFRNVARCGWFKKSLMVYQKIV